MIFSWIRKQWNRFFNRKEMHISKPKRKYDTNVITRQHYDYIMAVHSENAVKVFGEKLTQEELTTQFNMVFGFDKSRSAYRRIWNGKVSREELPEEEGYL